MFSKVVIVILLILAPICYSNETFQEGGYDCATCRNYKSSECAFIATAGCYCKPGYVRNVREISEDCILVKDCPLGKT